jgi:hypothetical protein
VSLILNEVLGKFIEIFSCKNKVWIWKINSWANIHFASWLHLWCKFFCLCMFQLPSTLTFCPFPHSFHVLFIILISWCTDKSMHCLCFPVLKQEMNAFSPLLMLRHNKICKCLMWIRDESNIYKVACRFPWLSTFVQVPKLGRFREELMKLSELCSIKENNILWAGILLISNAFYSI